MAWAAGLDPLQLCDEHFFCLLGDATCFCLLQLGGETIAAESASAHTRLNAQQAPRAALLLRGRETPFCPSATQSSGCAEVRKTSKAEGRRLCPFSIHAALLATKLPG